MIIKFSVFLHKTRIINNILIHNLYIHIFMLFFFFNLIINNSKYDKQNNNIEHKL